MSSIEEILRTETYKGEGLDTARRVHYTLAGDPHGGKRPESVLLDRTARLLALLVEHLEAQGRLRPEELDQLLFKTVQS